MGIGIRNRSTFLKVMLLESFFFLIYLFRVVHWIFEVFDISKWRLQSFRIFEFINFLLSLRCENKFLIFEISKLKFQNCWVFWIEKLWILFTCYVALFTSRHRLVTCCTIFNISKMIFRNFWKLQRSEIISFRYEKFKIS